MAIKKNNESERVKHNVKVAKVKKGHLMAFVYYGEVESANPDFLSIRNVDDNMSFRVEGKELIERSFSADQFDQEIKVNKTSAAEILISSHNRPFTVCFEKQDGEERVLRGRLITPEPLLGRSMVEDLEIKSGHRLRQVDHRTIKYLIVEGVKYTVSS